MYLDLKLKMLPANFNFLQQFERNRINDNKLVDLYNAIIKKIIILAVITKQKSNQWFQMKLNPHADIK